MTDQALLDLLCRCLAETDDPELGALLSGPNVPWPRLLDLANVTRVTPALHWRLSERDLLARIDGEVGEYLAGIAELAVLRNERHLDQLATVTRILNGVGIRPLALKGAASLVTRLYPTIGARHMFDVDVLVRPGRFDDAVGALVSAGYRIGVPAPVDLRAVKHYPRLSRRGSDPPVEVHHRVTTTRFAGLLPSEELMSAALPLRWRGVELSVPTRLHRMLHHIVHSWMEYAQAIPRHPMLLYSIEFRRLSALLTERDWAVIAERLERVGRRGSFERYVASMQRLGRHRIPGTVRPSRLARALAPFLGGLWPPPGPGRRLIMTGVAVWRRFRHLARTPRAAFQLIERRRWRHFWGEVARSSSWSPPSPGGSPASWRADAPVPRAR